MVVFSTQNILLDAPIEVEIKSSGDDAGIWAVDVLVENMHFSDSLLALSYFVSDKADEELARQNRQKRLNNRT